MTAVDSAGLRARASAGSDQPAVELCALTKRFGSTTAVDELSLRLFPGEVLGFLGPNGAGKTTTLRLALGFLRPTAGRVTVLGRDPWTSSELHREVGYVPGDVRLPPRRTGRELLDSYARLRDGVDGRLVDTLRERLEAELDRPVGLLSKGNRQKIALIQAFMSRPRLLLLDEPTSGLDPLAQDAVHDLLREAAAAGTAVLLSSHLLPEVERTAARVLLVRRGRAVLAGRVEDIRREAPRQVVVRFAEAPAAAVLQAAVPGLRDLQVYGCVLSCAVAAADVDALVKQLALTRVLDLTISEADLEDLFLAAYESGGAGDAR